VSVGEEAGFIPIERAGKGNKVAILVCNTCGQTRLLALEIALR